MLDSGITPFGVEACDSILHLDRHVQASLGVFAISLRLRVAEKNQHGIADELVDSPDVVAVR